MSNMQKEELAEDLLRPDAELPIQIIIQELGLSNNYTENKHVLNRVDLVLSVPVVLDRANLHDPIQQRLLVRHAKAIEMDLLLVPPRKVEGKSHLGEPLYRVHLPRDESLHRKEAESPR